MGLTVRSDLQVWSRVVCPVVLSGQGSDDLTVTLGMYMILQHDFDASRKGLRPVRELREVPPFLCSSFSERAGATFSGRHICDVRSSHHVRDNCAGKISNCGTGCAFPTDWSLTPERVQRTTDAVRE